MLRSELNWFYSVMQGIGSPGEKLPAHIGLPIGENHGGATYFVLQTHYNNTSKNEVTDSSGFYYTDTIILSTKRRTIGAIRRAVTEPRGTGIILKILLAKRLRPELNIKRQ